MFYDNYYYRPNHDAYNNLFGYSRPQDAAIERYLRRQEQERREATLARRRQRELLERKRRFEQKHQMALAVALEEEQRKRERQRLRDQQRALRSYRNDDDYHYDDDDESDYESDYEINVVRGRDGSLYYVKTPVNTQRRERQEYRRRTIVEEPTTYDSPSDSDSEIDEDDDASEVTSSPLRSRLVAATTPLARERHPLRAPLSPRKSPKRSRRHITVVTVEDASDSECESEFDSPWRNRRPSPGQWMEPVESYVE